MKQVGLSSTAYKRLVREHQMFQKEKDSHKELGFIAVPRQNNNQPNYKTWDVYFCLSNDSIYTGTILHAIMEFPHMYPLQPPSLRFISKMFHPNIYTDGRVCISILEEDGQDPTGYGRADDKWAPVQNIRTVLLSIVILLDNPNTESPANVDASKLLREKPEEYFSKTRAQAEKETVDVKLDSLNSF